MEELNINYGFVPSVIDGSETVLGGSAYETLPIPGEYSYRPIMSPILNQGAESTCVPHSISAFYDYWWGMNHADARRSDGSMVNTGMSIHQIYDAKTNAGDGMTYKEALGFCRDHGVTSEYNYTHKMGDKDLMTITDFALIGSPEILKRSLVMNGPACIATYVRDFNRPDFWNGSGMYGGHATSIIGYSDTKKAFILRNSWGTGWADGGYTWLPYSDFHHILEAWAVIGK